MEILYILDDSIEFTESVKELLDKKGGIDYRIFNDVDDFRASISKEMYAAVLDFWMPKMNGRQVMDEVKKVQPDCLVIIVSVNDERQVPLGVHNYKYVKFVSKSDENYVSTIMKYALAHFEMIRLEKQFKNDLRLS